jgi:hypothetical protein
MAKKSQEKLKIIKAHKTSPNTQCNLSPLDRHFHVSSLNHPINMSSTNFVHNFSPFGNERIKHNLREEWDAMHEFKIRVLHKVYKQVFKQLYSSLCQDLQDKSESSQETTKR